MEHLVEARETIAPLLKDSIEKFIHTNAPKDADAQVLRVADTFALFAVAGELAQSMGIAPWEDGMATWGVATCFTDWLKSRGGDGSGEMLMLVTHVKKTLALHATKHFDLWTQGGGGNFVDHKSAERWGFRSVEKNVTHFYLTAQGFDRLHQGYDRKATIDELHRLAILKKSPDGKNSVLLTIPEQAKARYYHLVVVDQELEEVAGE